MLTFTLQTGTLVLTERSYAKETSNAKQTAAPKRFESKAEVTAAY